MKDKDLIEFFENYMINNIKKENYNPRNIESLHDKYLKKFLTKYNLDFDRLVLACARNLRQDPYYNIDKALGL